MTFITPRDRDYLRVKQIKQGKSRVDPVYDAFIAGFRERYGVSPLAVLMDTIGPPREEGRKPRLGVVLERSDQYRAFVRGPFRPERYKQQAVAALFTKSMPDADLRAMFGLPCREPHAGVRADEIFVCFADFERVAKWELHDLVAGDELADFEASLSVGDQFWCIQRFAGPPIVFVHTDEQARTLRASAMPATWADTYFEIAKRHDEFGYLTRPEVPIQVDSKENFEANYSGNWYYYFK
jgi:hypothetical protein